MPTMACLSAQRVFQCCDRASSPEIDSGSNVTDNTSIQVAGAQEPLLRVKGGELPGAGNPGIEDRVGLDGNPDPEKPSGGPLMSLITPSLDPAPYGLRRDCLAPRQTCRRHPRDGARAMFPDCSISNVALVVCSCGSLPSRANASGCASRERENAPSQRPGHG